MNRSLDDELREIGSQPGLPGSPGFDRVLPGQFPNGFLLRPGPVPGPGQPGPGSTGRAGPGFKTMTKSRLSGPKKTNHYLVQVSSTFGVKKTRAGPKNLILYLFSFKNTT